MGKMASLLPGYEYDIFISYRQKDNKYDGWVTDFVDNLKRELEATFKEEISVYFDINPHDGLLETHDVDASLKEKLKCLVFIPIISRTYCDPRSFAWEHEFKAFIDQTSSDKMGLKVKLPNGNVGSRVLPVRIYDLDAADIKLCESVLGGVIRGVDFVYKEPGVNRPLTADDDEKKNLNNTKYRNQINKTANAIKEIISGLRSEPAEAIKERIIAVKPAGEKEYGKEISKPVYESFLSKIPGKNLLSALFLVLAAIGVFGVYKMINKADGKKRIDTSPVSAVQAEKNFNLGNKYSYDAHMSFTMANKNAEYISFSSAIEAYSKAIENDPSFFEAYAKRAIARAWGYYTRQLDSAQIEKCLSDINKAEEINNDFTDLHIARGFYYYYCAGDLEKAKNFFRIACEKEPKNEQPLFYLAMVYRRKGEWEQSFNLTRKLIALDPQEPLTVTNIGLTYAYFHDWDSSLLYHQKAIDNLPAWSSPYRNKIETLVLKYGNTSEARSLLDTAIKNTGANLTDIKIVLDIYDRKYSEALPEAINYQPDRSSYKGEKYLFLANIYGYLKNITEARIYFDSALVSFQDDLKLDNNDFKIHSYLGLVYAGIKNRDRAIEEGKRAVTMIEYSNFDKSDMILNLAKIYAMTGKFDEASGTIEYFLQTPMNMPSFFSMKLLEIDPVWESLIKSPEFKSMKRRISKN